MAVPPDPTQPTQPAPAVAVSPRRVAPGYLDPEEVLWRDEVRGRLRSLATALSVAIVVAFVALGVSLWALLHDDSADEGVGSARMRALEQRIDRLESAAGRGATRAAVARLQDQQQVLAQRLETLSDSAGQPRDDVEALQTAVDATQQAVEQLDQRVAALEQAP